MISRWINMMNPYVDMDVIILLLQLGWFTNPIFNSEGNYPAIMISKVANNSMKEGRTSSRLPTFSKEWIDKIRGSADFLGIY